MVVVRQQVMKQVTQKVTQKVTKQVIQQVHTHSDGLNMSLLTAECHVAPGPREKVVGLTLAVRLLVERRVPSESL